MKPELQKQLYDKYPKIFQDRTKSMKESCMYWGICTEDGWFNLLDELCHSLQWNTDKNNYPQVVADQVKEKFGGLRFYFHLGFPKKGPFFKRLWQSIRYLWFCHRWPKDPSEYQSGKIHGMVEFAESMSDNICEACGMPGEMNNGPWYRVRCHNCRDK